MYFDWETVRREDGTLDLVKAFDNTIGPLGADDADSESLRIARATLRDIESFAEIRSRQVAGLAIIMVAALGGTGDRISYIQDRLAEAAEDFDDALDNLTLATNRT